MAGAASRSYSLLPAAQRAGRDAADSSSPPSPSSHPSLPTPSNSGFFTAWALKVSVLKRQTGVETAGFLSSGTRNCVEFCHSLLSSRHRTQSQGEEAEPHLPMGGVSKSLRGRTVKPPHFSTERWAPLEPRTRHVSAE